MPKKIVVIDGDRSFASSISAELRARGLEAIVCGDGTQGLDLVRAERPDLVVLCVELPRTSGYSICNKLKKDEQLRSIPLVMTSAEATPETFEQHGKLRTHADEYLLKPFDAPALLQKIARFVELPPEDDDARLIDQAFDQLASGGDGAVAFPVGRAVPRPPAAPVAAPDERLQQALDAARLANERALIAEQRAAAAEARALDAEHRLRRYEDAHEKVRDALAAAARLLEDAPASPPSEVTPRRE